MTMATLVLLLGWAVLVGLDLVSVPQVMIARPLVAGTVAGAIAGDPAAGALVGAVLELFALDVLPVGAVRYPDYGIGAVAAAVAATGAPDTLSLGLAVSVGLVVALAGEWSMVLSRRWISATVRHRRDALNRGDFTAIRGTHLSGIARDALRSLLVGGAGLALAILVRRWPLLSLRGAILLTVVLVGVALGTGAAGALRLSGRARGLGWFVAGLAGGTVWVMAA